jgi:hypothetical protein
MVPRHTAFGWFLSAALFKRNVKKLFLFFLRPLLFHDFGNGYDQPAK